MKSNTLFLRHNVLKSTTSEAKLGFLLIEVFERNFNANEMGHLEKVDFSCLSGFLGIVHSSRFQIVKTNDITCENASGGSTLQLST